MEQRKGFWPRTSEREVGQFLFALCRLIEAKRVLEVGVWMGYTHTFLMETGAEVWGIDIEDQRLGVAHWAGQFIKGISWEVIPNLPGLFDLAFLDANHDYDSTCKELLALVPKVRDGGLIVCHDAIAYPEVKQAIDNMIAAFPAMERITLPTPYQPERWEKVCGLGILKKQL